MQIKIADSLVQLEFLPPRNAGVYILDEQFGPRARMDPVDVFGGDGLARGYLSSRTHKHRISSGLTTHDKNGPQPNRHSRTTLPAHVNTGMSLRWTLMAAWNAWVVSMNK